MITPTGNSFQKALSGFEFMFIAILCLTTDSVAKSSIATKSQVKFHCGILSQAECLALAGLKTDIVETGFDLRNGISNILSQLAQLGYPLATNDSLIIRHNSENDFVDIYIAEGFPLRLDLVKTYEMEAGKVIPNDNVRSDIVSGYFLWEGAYKLLTGYADKGFPFAMVTVIPSDISLEDSSLSADLSFQLNPGNFIRIGAVKFPGRSYTSAILLNNESRIRRGAIFNQAFIHRALTRLNKLEYINQSEPVRLLPSSPGIIDLYIPVTENKISTFTGVAAFDPQGKKLRGDANLSLKNMFGTGRKLEFIWEGLDPRRNGVSVVYFEPWLLEFPLKAEIGVEIWSGDSIGVLFNRHFGLDWQPNFNITVGGSINIENIELPSTDSKNEGYSSIWFSGSGSIDFLDRNWNPQNGTYLSTQSSVGIRHSTALNSASWTLHQEEIKLRFFREAHNKIVLALFGKVDDISGKRLTYADLISIGGINSLRGYAEGKNLVRGVFLTNSELRWRLDDSAFFGVFSDVGWVYREDIRNPVNEWLTSFGLTAAVQSNSTRININIGLAKGELIQQARLHVRIRRYF